MKPERPARQAAFTLIELLIVVAIIAVLAAIAVPNFLEAQVRAKVSRVKADMRSIATALEAYFVDENNFPPDHFSSWPQYMDRWSTGPEPYAGLFYLTTPTSYIASIPWDPFRRGAKTPPAGVSNDLVYSNPYYGLATGPSPHPGNPDGRRHAYCLISAGPDCLPDTDGYGGWPESGYLHFYDPTNGTTSWGDLYRFGGNYRQGEWYVGDEIRAVSTTPGDATLMPWYDWGNIPICNP